MTQADWVKEIESLRTSPTGAINMVFYNNGKKVGRLGVNKIEDLKEDLINLFKYEITLAQQRTEKKWRERLFQELGHEWEDPDIAGKIPGLDFRIDPVTTPVVRNLLRRELRERLSDLLK